MYHKAKFDTNYVERPAQRFNAQVFAENAQAEFSWQTNGYKAQFTTYDKISVGLKFSYMGVGGGYSFYPKYANNGSKAEDANKYSFHYYGRAIGGAISYLKSASVGGNIKNPNLPTCDTNDTLSQKMASADLYYVNNNKKFSYPAALTSRFLQRKPCGSLIFGLSALCCKTTNAASTTVMEQMSLSLGVGYGYNFLLKGKWLLHLSAIPMLVSSNKSSFKFEGQPDDVDKVNMGFIATERVAVAYNFSRYYLSANGVMTLHQFGDDDALTVNLINIQTHVDFGVRF